ncbi:MAG: Ig-like domain-containing protein [Dysgonamonadaceae bacterium]|jgi:hypothetical protein|nr:Ig-like domain-containing protein [Dysgonamonadaceae bacterium]
MKKMNKTSIDVRIFFVAALVYATCGCVKYDNFNITEKPYVDKSSVELYIGEGAGSRNQVQLKSAPEGNNFTWTSQDPSIASVSQSGLVTALNEGFAVITLASASDQTNVNVWVRTWVPLVDFTLDKQQVEVKRLDKIQVVASPVPQNASEMQITWTSSNPAVVAVYENGWIVGNEIGEAVVTATSSDGKQRQLTVSVVPAVERFTITAANIPGYQAGVNAATIGYSSQHGGYVVLNMFDGNITTFWHANYAAPVSNYPHWFIVDLRRSVVITKLMIQRRQTFISAKGFYFYTCPDVEVNQNDPLNGYQWVLQGDMSYDPLSNAEQYFEFDPIQARYVCIYFDTKHKEATAPNNYIQLAEFGIYGY